MTPFNGHGLIAIGKPDPNPERERRVWRPRACAWGSERIIAGHVRTATFATVVMVGGCFGPISADTSKSKTSTAHSRTKAVAKAAPINDDPSDNSPVQRMTVQAETVEAADLWLGHREELAKKADSLATDDYRSYVAERAAQLITDKIAEMLLYQRASLRQAEEVGKKIDAYVDGEIRKIVTEDHDGLQRRYEKYLESQGSSLEQARTQLRRQFVISGYLETEVRPKVAEPTRSDLLAAYESNREAWRRPARRSMSLIDIRVADLLPGDVDAPTREQLQAAREEAHSKIRAAQLEVRNGASFAEVARRYSHGARAAEGGAWGWVAPDSIRERFQPAVTALEKLRAGEVSDILETPDGFFLVRCDELEPALEPDFQTVQPQLKEFYIRKVYNQMIAELISELRTKARIEPARLERFHAAVVTAAVNPPVAASR
jgi:parvulin-like peptidyl-prolyl isomerase